MRLGRGVLTQCGHREWETILDARPAVSDCAKVLVDSRGADQLEVRVRDGIDAPDEQRRDADSRRFGTHEQHLAARNTAIIVGCGWALAA